MMNEHPTTQTLIDYLYHELAPEEDANVLAHLGACEACTAAYDAQARLSERLRAHALAEERELPPGVLARVREQVARESNPAWWQRASLLFRPVVGLPVAAVFVLALILGFSSLRPHVHAAIAAAYYLDAHAALTNSSMPFAQTAVVPSALEDSGRLQNTAAAIATNTIASE